MKNSLNNKNICIKVKASMINHIQIIIVKKIMKDGDNFSAFILLIILIKLFINLQINQNFYYLNEW